MAELVTFFGETGTKEDAERNAKYWLNEMDGYGDKSGSISLVSMRMPLGMHAVVRINVHIRA